jgi:hypothetical protein
MLPRQTLLSVGLTKMLSPPPSTLKVASCSWRILASTSTIHRTRAGTPRWAIAAAGQHFGTEPLNDRAAVGEQFLRLPVLLPNLPFDCGLSVGARSPLRRVGCFDWLSQRRAAHDYLGMVEKRACTAPYDRCRTHEGPHAGR